MIMGKRINRLIRVLIIVLGLALPSVSVVSASGEQTWQGVGFSGTNFYGHCMAYSGSAGKHAAAHWVVNGSVVETGNHTFSSLYATWQWQNAPRGYYPQTVLRQYCTIYDASWNILNYGMAIYTVPP
jgi:hypothetical protein